MITVERSEVLEVNTWNLKSIYNDIEEWKKDFKKLQKKTEKIIGYKGKLGESADTLKSAIELELSLYRTLEKIYTYAHLLSDQDTANTENLGLLQQVTGLYSHISALTSFITPELLSLEQEKIDSYLNDDSLKDYRRLLDNIVRYKPHTLSESEEEILAKGLEVFGSSQKIFSQLTNADFEFEPINIDGETKSLTQGTYVLYLKDEKREVREQAFNNFYKVFNSHKNTLAESLTSSIKKDSYISNVKKYNSTRERSLFSDNVPVSVYDNLINTVGNNLAPLHKYYKLRKKILGQKELRIFDTYVPLVKNIKLTHSYSEASKLICDSLHYLGDEYVSILKKGLTDERWVDKYENKGKRSGAYSSGCYDSYPYILMNYKPEDINSIFTLTHEAGHSMHSYYSRKFQPYQDNNYTIFVAEVASTFNEQLLTKHLRDIHKDNAEISAFLINQQIDDIKGTLYRQTMFAEFEMATHSLAQNNEPLTVDTYREIYTGLLSKYFGDDVTIHELDTLESLRIPHFYSSFYVYKYATGISAAVSLSKKVIEGGSIEPYLSFLQSGCSKYPLELLQGAGVDLTTPQPIQDSLKLFESLVSQLEQSIT